MNVFRIFRVVVGHESEQDPGARVREITPDNRVVFDIDSILERPAAKEHLAEVREIKLPIPTNSVR